MTVSHTSGIGRSEMSINQDAKKIRALLHEALSLASGNNLERATQSIRESLSGLDDDIEDFFHDKSVALGLSIGRGGNDPANRAAAYVEDHVYDLPAKVA